MSPLTGENIDPRFLPSDADVNAIAAAAGILPTDRFRFMLHFYVPRIIDAIISGESRATHFREMEQFALAVAKGDLLTAARLLEQPSRHAALLRAEIEAASEPAEPGDGDGALSAALRRAAAIQATALKVAETYRKPGRGANPNAVLALLEKAAHACAEAGGIEARPSFVATFNPDDAPAFVRLAAGISRMCRDLATKLLTDGSEEPEQREAAFRRASALPVDLEQVNQRFWKSRKSPR